MRGEKIDIIEFSEDGALRRKSPAAGQGRPAHHQHHRSRREQLEVIVNDTQLSLAIGKKGQNVRLAAKLLGSKMNIKDEEQGGG